MHQPRVVEPTIDPAIQVTSTAIAATNIDCPIESANNFEVITRICGLRWTDLGQTDLLRVAQSYYFFSVQFRENLHIACGLYPFDANLKKLEREECNTANLSPWPGVAAANEKMNHDEFMRRLLNLSPARESRSSHVDELGHSYLAAIRKITPAIRAMSVGSYEGGGLEKVFRAFLSAPDWDNPTLEAFQHFLIEHLRFDSDPEHGHGALSRHLAPDERVIPSWTEYERLLIKSAPKLAT
ncbi:MAG TPA: hypothetical protein VMV19_18515 [Xanthobacteraceae bacterium]|nr:hypothetical protein [Xanthobacteraceae bacterium]